ncbi:hypothetical protein ACM55H_02300 [Flavobacterium sp. ZT3R17]|uniref:hypothetical protein n=1 Tax=Flavobacterium cryoconiti TaxID=3398736 RepID=UPI003A87CB11
MTSNQVIKNLKINISGEEKKYKTKKTASFEAVFVPVTVELSNLFIEDLKKLSHAYKLLTKDKTP